MGIEIQAKMPKCPVCGKSFFISKDMPDGYYMGYSCGCVAYKANDGVHTKKMTRHNLNSREECEMWWRTVCEGRDLCT